VSTTKQSKSNRSSFHQGYQHTASGAETDNATKSLEMSGLSGLQDVGFSSDDVAVNICLLVSVKECSMGASQYVHIKHKYHACVVAHVCVSMCHGFFLPEFSGLSVQTLTFTCHHHLPDRVYLMDIEGQDWQPCYLNRSYLHQDRPGQQVTNGTVEI
jgi:hypothetical protein